MPLIVKYNENKPVPPGIYTAKLAKLEPSNHPQWGDSIRWTFDITEGEHVGVSVTAMSSTKVSPKSKVFSWTQAFGISMVPGKEFDLDELIGKTIRIRTINKSQNKNVDGKTIEMVFSNVDALAPYVPTDSSQQSEESTTTTPAAATAPAVSDATPTEEFSNTSGGLSEDQNFDF